MSNYDKQSHEQISNAAKRGWQTLKNNKKKYKQFCRKRSRIMLRLFKDKTSWACKSRFYMSGKTHSKEMKRKKFALNINSGVDDFKIVPF
jgi:hypothetical protein